jgi:hypothetical protein
VYDITGEKWFADGGWKRFLSRGEAIFCRFYIWKHRKDDSAQAHLPKTDRDFYKLSSGMTGMCRGRSEKSEV